MIYFPSSKDCTRDVEASGYVAQIFLGDSSMGSVSQKYCTKCGEWKDRTEFGKDSHKKDGLFSWCKQCSSKQTRRWQKEHPENVLSYQRVYRQRHPERIKRYPENDKKWRLKNKDKVNQKVKDWYAKHPGKKQELTKRYDALHPEERRARRREYKARKKNAVGTITAAEWQVVLDKYNHRCVYPGCNNTDVTMDHVIPLVLGGTHTIGNNIRDTQKE
jgi:5-methylcytosine-specific restriction endonuclease McrA